MAQITVNTHMKINESTAVVCTYIVIANIFNSRHRSCENI